MLPTLAKIVLRIVTLVPVLLTIAILVQEDFTYREASARQSVIINFILTPIKFVDPVTQNVTTVLVHQILIALPVPRLRCFKLELVYLDAQSGSIKLDQTVLVVHQTVLHAQDLQKIALDVLVTIFSMEPIVFVLQVNIPTRL